MRFLWDKSLVAKEEIDKLYLEHKDYQAYLREVSEKDGYSAPESSINLPSDEGLLKDVYKVSESLRSPKLKYIVDVGIGGSNLGTKAIYDTLFGFFDILEPDRFPKMVFLDTNDPEFLSKALKLLEGLSEEEVAVNVISKSGGTTETTANFELVYSAFLKRFPEIGKRFVATTDFESKLWNKAQDSGIATLPIPKTVGGRYSVLSSVGLLPLALSGIDVEALRAGANKMKTNCIENAPEENPAFLSAAILYGLFKRGFVINDNFFFHPELESIGKWYRQLMGESIGKENNLKGERVNAGITPTVSIGSTDLHSVGQLYLGGPKNKVTTFIAAESSVETKIASLKFPGLVDHLEGRSAKEIMDAILKGVKIAYEKKSLPFMEVILSGLNEKGLGEFLQFKMVEMMYLGRMFNVNTFDQPGVEDYKIETKKILSSPKDSY